jgi:hypothetical protein
MPYRPPLFCACPGIAAVLALFPMPCSALVSVPGLTETLVHAKLLAPLAINEPLVYESTATAVAVKPGTACAS